MRHQHGKLLRESRRCRPWCRRRSEPACRSCPYLQRSGDRARYGCRRRARSGRSWLVGKGAEHAARSWVTSSIDDASSASAIGSQSPTPVTMPMPRPPRMIVGCEREGERRKGGDPRAHRIAHDCASECRGGRAARSRRRPSTAHDRAMLMRLVALPMTRLSMAITR